MMHHDYRVARTDAGWTVEHRGKVLEVHPTEAEAEAHADRLARLTQASGHNAELIIEDEAGTPVSDEFYHRLT